MRVVLDFLGCEPWRGTVRSSVDPQAVTTFDGRLDLLRLLEAILGDGAPQQDLKEQH